MLPNSVAGLWASIINSTKTFLFAVYEPLSRDFQTTAIMLLTIYLVISIFILMRVGNFDMLIKMVVALIVFATVYQLVFTDGSRGFKEWIYAPIYLTSLDLTGYFVNLSSANSNGITGAINSIQNTGWDIAMVAEKQLSAGAWWERFGIDRFFTGLTWMIIALGYFIVGAAFVLYTLIGFLSMHILLAVSPIMFLLGAIPMTRHFFTSWMKGVITFALIPPFCGIVMGIMTLTLNKSLADIKIMGSQSDPFNMTTVLILTLYILVWYLLKKTPEYASAITGGAMTQLSGTAAAIGGAVAGYGAIASQTGATGLGKLGTEKLGNRLGGALKAWSQKKTEG